MAPRNSTSEREPKKRKVDRVYAEPPKVSAPPVRRPGKPPRESSTTQIEPSRGKQARDSPNKKDNDKDRKVSDADKSSNTQALCLATALAVRSNQELDRVLQEATRANNTLIEVMTRLKPLEKAISSRDLGHARSLVREFEPLLYPLSNTPITEVIASGLDDAAKWKDVILPGILASQPSWAIKFKGEETADVESLNKNGERLEELDRLPDTPRMSELERTARLDGIVFPAQMTGTEGEADMRGAFEKLRPLSPKDSSTEVNTETDGDKYDSDDAMKDEIDEDEDEDEVEVVRPHEYLSGNNNWRREAMEKGIVPKRRRR